MKVKRDGGLVDGKRLLTKVFFFFFEAHENLKDMRWFLLLRFRRIIDECP